MIPRGQFQCAICDEWLHLSKKKEAFRSYFPERKINVCEYCWDEYRNNPDYAHLRPDVDPSETEKIRKIREYYGDVHIFY